MKANSASVAEAQKSLWNLNRPFCFFATLIFLDTQQNPPVVLDAGATFCGATSSFFRSSVVVQAKPNLYGWLNGKTSSATEEWVACCCGAPCANSDDNSKHEPQEKIDSPQVVPDSSAAAAAKVEEVEQTSSHEVEENIQEEQQQPSDADAPAVVQEAHSIRFTFLFLCFGKGI